MSGETNEVLIARIDERTKQIGDSVATIERRLDRNYVTTDEFAPIKKIVYGMVAAVLLAVFSALVALVVKA